MQAQLSISEAAKKLNRTTRTIHNYIQTDPTFPARQIVPHGRWIIDPDELDEWIKNRNTYAEKRQAAVEASIPRRGRPPLSRTRRK